MVCAGATLLTITVSQVGLLFKDNFEVFQYQGPKSDKPD